MDTAAVAREHRSRLRDVTSRIDTGRGHRIARVVRQGAATSSQAAASADTTREK